MSYADALLPREKVDAKRIAATSGAIALHVAVLMMLMMPATPTATIEAPEVITDVFFKEKIKQPDPIPIKKPDPKPILKDPPKQDIRIREEYIAPIDDKPGPMDTKADEEILPPNRFDIAPPQGESVLQQLGVIVGPAPPYPRPALMRNIEGTVVLRIHVDAAGKPMEVLVETSSGSRILDEAAAEFVKKRWRFAAAQQNGQAVDAWGVLPVQFALH
jgi:protein TonB